MKIYMLWDMEGVSGLFTREHVWFWEEGVKTHIADAGRQLLIDDANSAARAALEAGAHGVIVSDTHHGGGNISLNAMFADSRITYHENNFVDSDGKRRWMPGMDGTVDGLMLMGHHAKAGTQNAFLPHTWTGNWTDFRINGQSVGEIGIETCYAGHWDVPPILVQGDEAACRETEAQFPGAVTAAAKRAETAYLCSGPDAEAARQLTAQKVGEAIEGVRAGRSAPYKPTLPMSVAIRMKTAEAAEAAAEKPGVRRVDEYTVEGRVERQCDVVRWILGVGME